MKTNLILTGMLLGLVLGLTACGTTTSGSSVASSPGAATSAGVEAALPVVRTAAAVATGGVLDFAVKSSATRMQLANEMYTAASAIYSLTGGSFPTPAQFQASIVAFGGSQAEANYTQFAVVIGAVYAAYYPKLATGDVKTAADLLNAIAGGIEDATQAYVTTPVAAN